MSPGTGFWGLGWGNSGTFSVHMQSLCSNRRETSK